MAEYKHYILGAVTLLGVWLGYKTGSFELLVAVGFVYLLDWEARRQDRLKRIAQVEAELMPKLVEMGVNQIMQVNTDEDMTITIPRAPGSYRITVTPAAAGKVKVEMSK